MSRRSRPSTTEVRIDYRCQWSSNGGHDKRAALFWIDTAEDGTPLHSRLPGGDPAPDTEAVAVACPACGRAETVRPAEVAELLAARAAKFLPPVPPFVVPVGKL